MRNCFTVFGLMFLAVIAKAGDDFLTQLSPADYAAAGLQKQTPDELARLNSLIEQYKSGELAKVRQAAAQAQLAQQEAEKKVAAAEAKAKEAESMAKAVESEATEARSKATAESAKKQPGWFKALITLRRAGEKPEKEQPLETQLVGEFDGWHGQTNFTMENGTRWRQQNPTERYDYSPVLHAPKVKIKPAVISGFWLEVEGVSFSVRVIPVELPEQK